MIHRSPYPDIEIPDEQLPAFVFEHADAYPDRPALIDGPSGRTLTYGQLHQAIDACAAGLAARGFGTGDVFAIYSPNIPEFAIAFFGVLRAGGVVTTLNPLNTPGEVAKQCADSGARFLVTVPPFAENARAAATQCDLETVYVFGEAEGCTPFKELLAGGGAPPEVTLDVASDLAVLPYSSGTTGLPKGVMLTHRNLVANVCQTTAIEDVQPSERVLGLLPFFHIYGMTVILSTVLRCGGTVVTIPRFDLDVFLGLVQAHEIKKLYIVPPIVLALAKHPRVDDFDLSSVEVVTSGAAPLPEPVIAGCKQRLGVVIKQGYGLTETSPVTHLGHTDPAKVKPTTVGHAAPNTEFRVVDVASGDDLPPGEPGELWIRGPQVMKGYFNRPDATALVLDDGGWFHTGDIASVDDDGYVTIVDRVKELIKYKGYQVAPAELEALLQGHPDVADAAVVPHPDEEAGEIPKAFVVLKPGARITADEVMEYVAAEVAPYKKIRRVEFVDEIPKTASGKILRRKLVDREPAA